MSVWVEICQLLIKSIIDLSRSTWACELKWCLIRLLTLTIFVTLHVSVWVEMTFLLPAISSISPSRSTWACELKFLYCIYIIAHGGHAPRERVSWNFLFIVKFQWIVGHAPRERVSWNFTSSRANMILSSGHAPRERVSWNVNRADIIIITLSGHAPRERVSWNSNSSCRL